MTILSTRESESDVVVAEQARAKRLQAAIDHHQAALKGLFDDRRRHVIELHLGRRWSRALIGRLYRLTRERIRQIAVHPTRTDVDDGEVT